MQANATQKEVEQAIDDLESGTNTDSDESNGEQTTVLATNKDARNSNASVERLELPEDWTETDLEAATIEGVDTVDDIPEMEPTETIDTDAIGTTGTVETIGTVEEADRE